MTHLSQNILFYVLLLALVLASVLIDTMVSAKAPTLRQALRQFVMWVGFAMVFFGILLFCKGATIGLKYITGYFLELSLSMDNVFVFIIIFRQYLIPKQEERKLLLIAILVAIVLRIVFIASGIEIIAHFAWVMYVFGPILLYTGFKIMWGKEGSHEDAVVKENKVIQFLKKALRFTDKYPAGAYYFRAADQKRYFTTLAFVVMLLAITDLVFALDSIPTIISLIRTDVSIDFSADEVLVIYASNIFAVLGLRALFIILQEMKNQFEYLQKSIGIILMFIGLKMVMDFFRVHVSIYVSLVFIFVTLLLGLALSQIKKGATFFPSFSKSIKSKEP